MMVLSAKCFFYLRDSFSLKDKRKVKNSLIEKTKQRFNVAVAEVDTQDQLKHLTIGVAVVAQTHYQADKLLFKVISFMENEVAGELVDIEK